MFWFTCSICLVKNLTAVLCIPLMAAGTPGQLRSEGCEEIIQSDGDDHVVIDAHQTIQYHVAHSNTWKYISEIHK